MINSNPALTLRELLRDSVKPPQKDAEFSGIRVTYMLQPSGFRIIQVPNTAIDQIESALLAPLQAEIAQLRSKVAAADRFREYAGNFVSNATVSDPYLSEQWGYLTSAYDATKTEGTAALVGEDEHQEECNLAARHEREFREWVKHRPDLGGTYLNLMHHWIGDEFGNPPGFATPPAVEDAERSCIECGGQGYWDDPRSASLRRTCWTCKGTGITPPAVADAGETGEEREDTIESLRESIGESFDSVDERLAALRRDVDALKGIAETQRRKYSLWCEGLEMRIASLESRERPEPGSVVTDAMIDAFWTMWGVGLLDALTREPLRAALSAALAAREAGQ